MKTKVVPNYYTDRLDQALDGARIELEIREAVVADADWANAFQFDGVPYGTSKSVNIELTSLRGRPTKKYAHLTVWRLDSGRYEWNMYVL